MSDIVYISLLFSNDPIWLWFLWNCKIRSYISDQVQEPASIILLWRQSLKCDWQKKYSSSLYNSFVLLCHFHMNNEIYFFLLVKFNITPFLWTVEFLVSNHKGLMWLNSDMQLLISTSSDGASFTSASALPNVLQQLWIKVMPGNSRQLFVWTKGLKWWTAEIQMFLQETLSDQYLRGYCLLLCFLKEMKDSSACFFKTNLVIN